MMLRVKNCSRREMTPARVVSPKRLCPLIGEPTDEIAERNMVTSFFRGMGLFKCEIRLTLAIVVHPGLFDPPAKYSPPKYRHEN